MGFYNGKSQTLHEVFLDGIIFVMYRTHIYDFFLILF